MQASNPVLQIRLSASPFQNASLQASLSGLWARQTFVLNSLLRGFYCHCENCYTESLDCISSLVLPEESSESLEATVWPLPSSLNVIVCRAACYSLSPEMSSKLMSSCNDKLPLICSNFCSMKLSSNWE